METFKDYKLSNELQAAIQKLGFTTPTEIQQKSLPHLLQGKDVIGESATGSGKTLAFGCSIIDHTIAKKGVQAVILTPTRELALQVTEAMKDLAKTRKLRITTVYGGVDIEKQIHQLTKAEIVVATPGRFLDHLSRRTLDTSNVRNITVDEADRMLDMGFIDDVEKIIKACKNRKQTVFFSATIMPRIKKLCKKYMKNPIFVSAKKHVDPSKLKQIYYDIPKNIKLSLLVHLLRKEKRGLVMIFCNTRRTTDFVVKNLRHQKLNAIALHGGMSQNKRTKTIHSFNDAACTILVCTDVAARGLHIENVSHIYNYEIPKDSKEYVHRIGRTARAGEEGMVINLLCEYDYDNFGRIKQQYREFKITKQEKPYVDRVKAVMNHDRSRRSSRTGRSRHTRGPPRRRFSHRNRRRK